MADPINPANLPSLSAQTGTKVDVLLAQRMGNRRLDRGSLVSEAGNEQ